jgi:hypothetical protein
MPAKISPSYAEVDRLICAPGGPFEMEDVVLHGRAGRVWKHASVPERAKTIANTSGA